MVKEKVNLCFFPLSSWTGGPYLSVDQGTSNFTVGASNANAVTFQNTLPKSTPECGDITYTIKY